MAKLDECSISRQQIPKHIHKLSRKRQPTICVHQFLITPLLVKFYQFLMSPLSLIDVNFP